VFLIKLLRLVFFELTVQPGRAIANRYYILTRLRGKTFISRYIYFALLNHFIVP